MKAPKLGSYYDLREAKAFNDFLETADMQDENVLIRQPSEARAKEILDIDSKSLDYRETNDYVPGSAKHQEIVDRNATYAKNREYLKLIKHKKEEFIYESGQNIHIYKHTYVEMEYPRQTYYSEDEYYSGETDGVVQSEQIEVLYTFWSNGAYNAEPIGTNYELSFKSFKIPYSKKDGYHHQATDLIQDALDYSDRLKSEIFAYQLCERLGIKFRDLETVFNIYRLDYYSPWIHGEKYCLYRETYSETDEEEQNSKVIKYTDKDILALIAEYQVEKTKNYVQDDKFIDVSEPYVDFKKLVEAGVIKHYTPISQ